MQRMDVTVPIEKTVRAEIMTRFAKREKQHSKKVSSFFSSLYVPK